MWWNTTEYQPWRYMIPRDVVMTAVLCFGERLAERILLPGLHRSPGRLVVDPARADDLSVLAADAFALMMLVWMFVLGLYTFSLITKRPLKPYATTLVASALVVMIFIGSTAEWFVMPVSSAR